MNKHHLAVGLILVWVLGLSGSAVMMHEDTKLDATATVTNVNVEDEHVQTVTVSIENPSSDPLSLTAQFWRDDQFSQANWAVVDVPAQTTRTVTLKRPNRITVPCEKTTQLQLIDGAKRTTVVFTPSNYTTAC